MRIFHILRAHPWVSLVVTLAFALVLIIFWSQLPTAPVLSHDVPPYPDAQNLSHETPLFNGGWVHDCGHNGEGRAAHTRFTRFETAATPDAVLQFYTDALVDRGPYEVVYREHGAVLGYGLDLRPIIDDGEQASFEYETAQRTEAVYPYSIGGYGVAINAAPVAGRTTVEIIEYHYERTLGRSCHPW